MAEPDTFWMQAALGRPQLCGEDIGTHGILSVCNQAAVGLRFDPDEDGMVYPVCMEHARDEMVTLESVVRFFLYLRETERQAARGLVRMAAADTKGADS